MNYKGREKMDYYRMGQRIRKYRKACELSQEQLAEKIGISVTHMSHIETGNTKMSLAVAADIANALSVHLDALLYDRPRVNRTDIVVEVIEVLESCSEKELFIILDNVKYLKEILRKHLESQ